MTEIANPYIEFEEELMYDEFKQTVERVLEERGEEKSHFVYSSESGGYFRAVAQTPEARILVGMEERFFELSPWMKREFLNTYFENFSGDDKKMLEEA